MKACIIVRQKKLTNGLSKLLFVALFMMGPDELVKSELLNYCTIANVSQFAMFKDLR